jgi:hypothetical protein
MTHLYGHVGQTLLISLVHLPSHSILATKTDQETYQHLSLDSSSTPIVKLLEQYGQNNMIARGYK